MHPDKLSQFIETLYNIQKQNIDIELSDQKLKELALSAGFTQSDWEYFEREFNDIIERAKNHFQYKNYKLAIDELENAIKIKPTNTTALDLLAQSYYYLYQEQKSGEKLNKAEKYALELIKLQPENKKAYEILSFVAETKLKKKRRIIVISGTLVIILIILAFVIGNHKDVLSTQEREQEVSNINIPVIIKPSDYNKFFDIKIDTLITHDYGKSYTVNVFGYLRIKEKEAKKIDILFRILDKDGYIIDQSTKKIWDCDFWLYKNDIVPFYDLSYQSTGSLDNVQKVEVQITDADLRPAQPHKKPQNMKMRICNGCNWKISVKIRDKKIEYIPNSDKAVFKGVLIFENKDTRPINKLKYRIILYDKTGEPLHSSDYFAVIEDEPEIKPGSYFLDAIYKTLPKEKAQRFSYAVIEILEIG